MDRELVADCVHCGFCLPTCPTYQLWGEEMDSPRGRIYLMEARLDGTVQLNRTVVQHFDACLGCMACVTSCPSGVQYDKLIELTRERVEEEFERSPRERLVRAAVFRTLPYPRRMKAALALAPLGKRLPGPLRPLATLAPPWRSSEAPAEFADAIGERRGRVALLTGCVASVLFGDVNTATARVLCAEGFEVVAPHGQGCCGALSVHGGRRDEGKAFARRTIEAFERTDADFFVTNAAGCGSNLKEYGFLLADDPEWAERAERLAARVRDISEVLAEIEPRAKRKPLPLRVAFQDSCHLLHAQGISQEPRTMLGAIPELVVTELPEQEICCGSAGIYNIVMPDAAAELGTRKAGHVAEAAPDAYASANPGCLVQVTTALRKLGRPTPAFHPIELVDASIRGESAARLLARARR